MRTAKILYRKFETYIPRKGTTRPKSHFLHSCFWVRFIHIYPQSICIFFCRKWMDRSWEFTRINRSQAHECGNWDWGRAVPFLGIHQSSLCSVVRKILLVIKSLSAGRHSLPRVWELGMTRGSDFLISRILPPLPWWKYFYLFATFFLVKSSGEVHLRNIYYKSY